MKCAFEDCTSEGTITVDWQPSLCYRHRAIMFTHYQGRANAELSNYFEKVSNAPEPPGWAYVVILPNGRWKVGYTEKEVDHRFRNLERDWGGPVIPVAVVPGGRMSEARLHEMYRSLRVEDELGEQFTPDFAMATSAICMGIDFNALDAVARYLLRLTRRQHLGITR